MSFYDNYVSLCNKIGKTPSAVAIEIGLSKPAVHRWKNGGTPTDATAKKVADYFGISSEKLFQDYQYNLQLFSNGGNEDAKKPNDQKAVGLKDTGYELLTPENRSMIDSLIASLLKSQSGE